MQNALSYYAAPGEITHFTSHHDFLDWIMPDPMMLHQLVQGLMIHDGWLKRYEAEVSDAQWFKQCLPTAQAMLDKVFTLDKRNPAIPRAPENQIIGCCRDYTVFLCALLRYKGVPARARCGFSTYLAYPGKYEDHWICEVWKGDRWVQMDAQVDPFQQSTIKMKSSPFDLPEGAFITGAEAWRRIRQEGIDSMRFGISGDASHYGLASLFGEWFARGNLLRDFAALNKVEDVPFLIRLNRDQDWSQWRLVGAKDDEVTEKDYRLLDTIAELALDPDKNHEVIRELYNETSDLQPPRSHITGC